MPESCPPDAEYTPIGKQCLEPECTRLVGHVGEHHCHAGSKCISVWRDKPEPNQKIKEIKPKEAILDEYMKASKISGIPSDGLFCPFCRDINIMVLEDEEYTQRGFADTAMPDYLVTLKCNACGEVWQQVGVIVFSKPLVREEMTAIGIYHSGLDEEDEAYLSSLEGLKEDFEEGSEQRKIDDKPTTVWVNEGKVWENV